MQSIIKLEQVSFYYDEGKSPALENINLAIMPGEFIGIIGPNGGGKSTLLKLLLGLLKPQQGIIQILGDKPRVNNARIGYVPQFTTFKLDFPISVEEVVLTGRIGITEAWFGYTKNDRNLAAETLDMLEIIKLRDKSIGHLSGGQLQRVMIARALVCKPKILLLDEPTANIDIHAEKNIFDLLKKITNETTILVVSHDIGFISKYIKNVACINKTLVCHKTYQITPEIIEKTYGIPIRAIKHE